MSRMITHHADHEVGGLWGGGAGEGGCDMIMIIINMFITIIIMIITMIIVIINNEDDRIQRRCDRLLPVTLSGLSSMPLLSKIHCALYSTALYCTAMH